MGMLSKRTPVLGHTTTLRVAYGSVKPSIIISSIACGTLAAKGATTISVTGVTQPIPANNWVLFYDSVTETEVVVKVTAAAASAASSLTVAPLEAAIPVGAIATYPPEIMDRTAADLTREGNSEDVQTLNTGGRKLSIVTGITESISAPGNWHHLNAGLKNCEQAFGEQKTVWVICEYDKPSAAYSRGEVILALATLPNCNRTSPSDNFMVADMEFNFSGVPDITPPALAV